MSRPGGRRGSAQSSVSRGSKLIIQNGSFFYPKQPGFRETAKYTEILGERDLKRYTQGPGGMQTLRLGSAESVVYSSSSSEAMAVGVDETTRAAQQHLPLAGTSNASKREKEVKPSAMRVSQPPGGLTNVSLGVPDENPRQGKAPGTFAPVSEVARYKLDHGIPAGIKCMEYVGEDYVAPAGKKLLQGVGGDDHIVLGDPALPVPQLSLQHEDQLLAYHPVLVAAAGRLQPQGEMPKGDGWVRKAQVAGYWTQDRVHIRDDGYTEEPNTVWEVDVQKSLAVKRAEEEKKVAWGEEAEAVKENAGGYENHAGVKLNPDVVKPRGLRLHSSSYKPTGSYLEYTSERNDEEARLSPPRAKGIPLHADPRTLSARRRPVTEPMRANQLTEPGLIAGVGGGGDYKTTYQVACETAFTRSPRPVRSLVKRMQTAGGHSTVSLEYDPEAAGVRTKLDHVIGGNPIAPQYEGFGAQPVPSAFGKKVAFYRTVPLDKVVITRADYERTASVAEDDSGLPFIRRVAPPGGATSLDLH